MRFSEEEAYAIVQTPKARKRFDDKVMPEPNSGCWLWLGASGVSGHGQFFLGSADGRRGLTGTHRVSYMLHIGKIPEGMHVCHRCDNPACVNPAHLFLGTHVDNMADMRAKNRMVMPGTVGAANSQAILTEAQVLEIRASRLPTKLLAARFGVTGTCIHEARVGVTWAHLPNARPARTRNVISAETKEAIRSSTETLAVVCARYGVSPPTVIRLRGAIHRPEAGRKLSEYRANCIEDTGTRRKNESGRLAIVWRVKA